MSPPPPAGSPGIPKRSSSFQSLLRIDLCGGLLSRHLGPETQLVLEGGRIERDAPRDSLDARALQHVRKRVYDALDAKRGGCRRLLELSSGVYRSRANAEGRQPNRAVRAAPRARRERSSKNRREELVNEVLERDVQAFLERAEERGEVGEVELEALAFEQGLDEDELNAVTAEL